jgi:AcrR family transcriptional regulator
MTTETSGTGDISRSMELLWGKGERPARGPRPGLSLEQIVTTAIEVADAEGLGAVSMRRIATELGTGAMSLYRYVPGKAELLDLMQDRVYDPGPWELPAPGVIPDWRRELDTLGREYLDLYRTHPWLLRINSARSVLGPGALSGLEAALTGLQGLRLPGKELISVIVSVQSLASGIARMEADAIEASEETGLSHDEFWEAQTPWLEQAMAGNRYPKLAALEEDTFSAEFDQFGFGMEQLKAGLERLVRERAAGSPPPPQGTPLRRPGGTRASGAAEGAQEAPEAAGDGTPDTAVD